MKISSLDRIRCPVQCGFDVPTLAELPCATNPTPIGLPERASDPYQQGERGFELESPCQALEHRLRGQSEHQLGHRSLSVVEANSSTMLLPVALPDLVRPHEFLDRQALQHQLEHLGKSLATSRHSGRRSKGNRRHSGLEQFV